MFEAMWGHAIQSEPGLRIPEHVRRGDRRPLQGVCSCRAKTSPSAIPNTVHVMTALRSLELLVVQDLFVNETAKLAHVFFPGTSFLEKDGTFTNAERRINRVRPVMRRAVWKAGVGAGLRALRCARCADALRAGQRDHGRDRRAHTDVRRRVVRQARRGRQRAVAVQRSEAAGYADHARGHLRTRPRQVQRHPVRSHRGALEPSLPAVVDDRSHPQPVQRGCADPSHRAMSCGTRRTSSRSIRTTPRSAGSPTATRSPWPVGSARPPSTRWSPIGCPRASSTPPSITPSAVPMW